MSLSPRRTLIGGAARTLDLLGLAALGRRRNRRLPAVLMYHGVVERPPRLSRQILVRSGIFARHMEHLARHHRVVHLSELVQGLQGGDWPDGAVAVTFDDGLRSNYSLAFPHLRRFEIPATVFLTTGHIGTARPLWQDRLALALELTDRRTLVSAGNRIDLSSDRTRTRAFNRLVGDLLSRPASEKDEQLAKLLDDLEVEVDEVPEDHAYRPLGWEEVREMARDGLVEFGAHTRSHDSLVRQDPGQASAQIRASRDDITERTGKTPELFAYPNGDESRPVREEVRLAGFRAATVASPGRLRPAGDAYRIPRYGVGANHDLPRFRLEVSGILDRWVVGPSR